MDNWAAGIEAHQSIEDKPHILRPLPSGRKKQRYASPASLKLDVEREDSGVYRRSISEAAS